MEASVLTIEDTGEELYFLVKHPQPLSWVHGGSYEGEKHLPLFSA